MAQKREIICDRCEKVIVNLNCHSINTAKENSAKINWWGVGQHRSYGGQRIDLCAECANKFVEFLEKAEAEDGKTT